MSKESPILNPEILMINDQIEKIIKEAETKALSKEDLDRLDSLIKMRKLLQDQPSIIYVKDYSEVYDRTILSTIKNKAKPPKPKNPNETRGRKKKSETEKNKNIDNKQKSKTNPKDNKTNKH